MGDMTILTGRWCASNEAWSKTYQSESGNGSYVVTYGPVAMGPYSHGYTCACPGFGFRGKCKHITAAKSERCAYGWEAAAGSPVRMGKTCPKCHGSTAIVNVAV